MTSVTERRVSEVKVVSSLCVISTSKDTESSDTWLSVAETGEVQFHDSINRPDQPPYTTQATPDQLAALRKAITSSEWQQLASVYGTSDPNIVKQRAVCGERGIDVYPDAERPAILTQVMQQMETLRQQAISQ